MPGLVSNVDPDGLLEYSVVFTDRSLNHMSQAFQEVMRDISATLKEVYAADAVAVVPGGGTFGMEAVARQFGTGRRCLVVRNGWFSYRWTQIFEAGDIPSEATVLKARQVGEGTRAPFAPAPIEEVVAAIEAERPHVVFAPHVETSAGLMLPDGYIRAMADAVHAVGGILVIDSIASGAVWLDMRACGIDVLVSAPQKGWTGTPCAGLVMLSALALERLDETTSTSFACDLKKWLQIMKAYEDGGHAYHATMPTDGLRAFRDVMRETGEIGFGQVRSCQLDLGAKVRAAFQRRGVASVAAPGFEAPGVVVCYAPEGDAGIAGRFAAAGLQIAAGVPLACDEPDDFSSFRIGLFGLDKLTNVDRTVQTLEDALDRVL